MISLLFATHAALEHPLPGVPLGDTAAFSAGLLDVVSPVGHLSVFHTFVASKDPTAPLIVWMNGGPGASSLMGFFTELGPLLLNLQSFNDSTAAWTPFSNPYAWSTVGALLAWEQPAGVGFSRCLAGCPTQWNDTTSAAGNLAILRAFYAAHPSERSRTLIIAGESYGGICTCHAPTERARRLTMSRSSMHAHADKHSDRTRADCVCSASADLAACALRVRPSRAQTSRFWRSWCCTTRACARRACSSAAWPSATGASDSV
jgi:hypothetical protein